MRRSIFSYSYQRGSWSPGSKHQKHMSVNPTYFLYRFPGSKGPGPYTMKYWWTLGCFPTGLAVPFRLQEFLSTYQQFHIPVEVEEWLQFVIVDPIESLKTEISNLSSSIDLHPEFDKNNKVEISGISAHPFTMPLKKIENTLGVFISPSSLAKTLKHSDLRERVLDYFDEYKEHLTLNGSTPHRRFARYFFESPLDQSQISSSSSSQLVNLSHSIPEKVTSAIGCVVDPPPHTAPDEKTIIKLLSTIAEGSSREGLLSDARETLYSALQFSHDSTTQSHLYSNIASSALGLGEFKEAEYYAQESLLTAPHTAKKKSIYKLWCSAVAHQGDFLRCGAIMDEALEAFPGDSDLQLFMERAQSHLNENEGVFQGLAEKRHRSKLGPVQSQQLPLSTGRIFDNEFSWTTFKNKLYPSKMNPSSNEMGSVFRRVGDLGLHTSTSRSTEFL